jgi:hypothetical protein
VTAVRRTSALGLAVLLAAATAAADIIITTDEVIPCWDVGPTGSDSVCFMLPRLERRTVSALDIYEIRLADSGRVVALSSRLPQLRVVLDSGQPIPAPAARTREMPPLRENLNRPHVEHPESLDTVCPATTPEKMMAKYVEMDILLRKRERNDTAVVNLLREVHNEQAALRGIWPDLRTHLLCGACGTLGMAGGTWLGWTADPPQLVDPSCGTAPGTGSTECWFDPGTCVTGAAPVGCFVGSIFGSALGAGVGRLLRDDALRRHRNCVNDLVRRANRAIAAAP